MNTSFLLMFGLIINTLTQNKHWYPDGLMGNFYQKLKDEWGGACVVQSVELQLLIIFISILFMIKWIWLKYPLEEEWINIMTYS